MCILRKYLVGFIFFLSIIIYAQENTITGNVSDEYGFPVTGALVSIKGMPVQTETDSDGFFELSSPNKIDVNSILVVDMTGFQSKEIKIGNKRNFQFFLTEVIELKEVVAVGFGSQKRENITGAVSTIDEDMLKEQSNTNVGNLIQGRATGVIVQPNSGKPNAGFSIRIRGTNSITAGSEPLYIVDGVPINDTRTINPADIENISILKDAASAAIYGAQGANGVVLITTKKGKLGQPKVSLNTYVSFTNAWRTLDVLNSEQYRDLMTEMGQSTDWDAYNYNTDWQKEIFQTGITNNYQLSVSGKNNGTNYYVSGGYFEQTGIVKSSESNRINFKVNLDQEINDKLTLGTRLAYIKYSDVDIDDFSSVNSGGVIIGALATPPNISIYNDDGTFTSNPFQNWENPISRTDGLDRKYEQRKFIGNTYLEYKPIKHVTFKTDYGVDLSDGIYNSFLDPYRTSYGQALNGRAVQSTDKYTYGSWTNTLGYKNTFGQHKIETMIGSVLQNFKWENSYIETRNFASDAITTPNGGSVISSASATKSKKNNTSFIARLNYDFANKYLLTANMRADGSSVFGPNNRWGYFPSLSVGWKVSKESFMDNVDFINNLKLRAGWGIVGNDNIGTYAYFGTVGSGANYPIGGIILPGTFPSTIENPSLKWEESHQTSIGVDLSMFANRITFSADAYINKTEDLLLNTPLPNTTGYTSALRNIGNLENKGLEFNLKTVNVESEKFNWSTNYIFNLNRNKVTYLAEQELYYGGIAGRGEASLVREGEPLGIIYGYVFGGVDPQTGNAYYIDTEGNSTFTPTAEDRRIIGDANPDFQYSIGNNFSYKNFSLNIFLQGSYGGEILNATQIEMEGMSDPKNQFLSVVNRWREPGDITNIPRATWGNVDNSRISTRFIEDASYLRFKTVTLSYEFPQNWLSNVFVNNLNLYVTAENLFTFTNYDGFDPEVNAYGGSNTERGIDYGTYPQTRNFIFGLNVSF